MADEKDALEGLNIIEYEEDTEEVTIEIHPLIIKHSPEALGRKIIEIIESGPSVRAVTIVPRREL